MRPGLAATAPVKAPRSWPKSSDSSSWSGSAAQLMATNGPWLRREPWWMKRATTSLPVPDSPVSSTVVSVWATRVACASTSFHCLTVPDDAAHSAAGLELARERGHLGLEPAAVRAPSRRAASARR